MSKRWIIIAVAAVVVVVAAGVGFWFVRSRQVTTSPSSPATSVSSSSASGTIVEVPRGSGLGAQVSSNGSAVPNSASSNSLVRGVSADMIPQRIIQMGEAPQDPMVVYQGRTMTQDEFKKSWATSSTLKQTGIVVPSKDASVKSSPDSDKDRDGLTYDQEMKIGTDPNSADTDGDGLTDGEELNTYKTNPKNFDTDGDGLTDGEEVSMYKTDPSKADTDGDGYTDGAEVKSGYNPLGSGKLK